MAVVCIFAHVTIAAPHLFWPFRKSALIYHYALIRELIHRLIEPLSVPFFFIRVHIRSWQHLPTPPFLFFFQTSDDLFCPSTGFREVARIENLFVCLFSPEFTERSEGKDTEEV